MKDKKHLYKTAAEVKCPHRHEFGSDFLEFKECPNCSRYVECRAELDNQLDNHNKENDSLNP